MSLFLMAQSSSILAQVDIVESNSMIEAWWRQLKHEWVYLNELDSESSVRKLIAFYVEQHNSVVPHFAFQGQTPDEMYFGTGANVPVDLQEKASKSSSFAASSQSRFEL